MLIALAIVMYGFMPHTQVMEVLPESGAQRFIDHDAGVVCWLSDTSMDCLPLSQTMLTLERE